MQKARFISCVSTLYRSERFVEEFVRRMASALESAADDYELILVDDGTPDRSRELAVELIRSFPKLRVIELSRNFGHHAAILAGLETTKGDLVFFVDSDLEEPPELLRSFLGTLRETGADVVYGIYGREDAPFLRRVTSKAFWYLLSKLTDIEMPRDIANVRIMRREYVDALLTIPDRNIFLGGMFAWPGFRQHPLRIERFARTGASTYSWRKRMGLAGRAAVAFSDRPLFLVFGLGLSLSSVAFAVGFYFLVKKLLNPDLVLSGFTSVIISIWLLGGLILGGIGVLGFYIAHIYNQTRSRPRFIVRQVYAQETSAEWRSRCA